MKSSANNRNGNVVPIRRPEQRVSPARIEAARYMAQMTLELEQLANTSGLEMVGYFLAMARAEAATVAESQVAEPATTDPQATYRPE